VTVGTKCLEMIDDVETGLGIVGGFDAAMEAFPGAGVALAIGYRDLSARWTAWQRVLASARPTPVLEHPRAYVASTASIGAGSFVMAGAIVDRAVSLREIVVVWPGACINHDVHVGDNCFVSPNATLCRFARVGSHSFIGAGAAVVDHGVVPASSYVRMLESYTRKDPL